MNQPSRTVAKWRGHPVAAQAVRVAIFVIPFLTAMVVAVVLSARVPAASAGGWRVLRWLGIVAMSTLAMMAMDKLARRFLPLSILMRLTLVFPDQAPSRFRVAMRTGTTTQLKKRLEEARSVPEDETAQQAAERLLELVGLLSQHDRLTRGHSERVRAYSHLLGEEMGLTESELDKLRWAGLLHDVGKTMVSTEILNKPSRLTASEYETIKSHPEHGRVLVAPLVDWLGESARAVWEHHERFDGQGYPRGLAGTEISFAARLVSVADCYDVMTSARSYKKPLAAADARAELARCAGTQFDPVVVRSFMNISLGRLRLMTGPLAWFAQLALFEPSGIVHAGSAGGQQAVAAGATTGSGSGAVVASASASTAASAGTSGLISTFAAAATSVVVSTAGVVVASPPATPHEPPVQMSASAPVGIELADLGEPAMTTVVIAGIGEVEDGSADVSSSARDSNDGVPPAPAAAAASDTPETSSTLPTDGVPSPAEPDSTVPFVASSVVPVSDMPGRVAPTTAPPASTTSSTIPAPPDTSPPRPVTPPIVVVTTTAPRTTTTVATTTTTTTVAPATTTTTTTVAPATTTTTTTTTVAPATTTTTTTTVATTPSTTMPPLPPLPPGGPGRRYLGGDVTMSTTSRAVHNMRTVPPSNIALANLDTDRDAAPGVVIARSLDGVNTSDPSKVLRFVGSVPSSFEVDGDVDLELYVAAKDFSASNIVVQVAVYRCRPAGSCQKLGSETSTVAGAATWTKKRFTIDDVEEDFSSRDWMEIRVAVLDSSQSDGWFAFGTQQFAAAVTLELD